MRSLAEKIILVTGSGRGFGRAMAYSYAMRGAKTIALALEDDELEDVSRLIRSEDCYVYTITTDISKCNNIYKIQEEILEEFGGLDVIVNNAAFCPWSNLENTSIEVWDEVFAVNIRAPFILSKVFSKIMKDRGGGSIINITSRSAEIGFLAEIAFSPTKWALEGFTQCLAMELQPSNIAVNTLKVASPPGKRLKPTGMTLSEVNNQNIGERFPTEKEMSELFGEAWEFIALQDANGVTGQRLGTRELADYLRENGWEAALAKWSRKLTKAVYVSYDFPESVRYQTPEGGFKEQKFEFNKN